MRNNYDSIAPVYDFLSRIIFGSAIIDSQVCLLPFIPVGAKVLVAGGGSGLILEEIAEMHESGLHISYVEISQRMIKLSKKRNYKNNEVNFIHQSIEEFIPQENFDVIITPFLFDNFQVNKIISIIDQLDGYLNTHGVWLYVDFMSDQKVQKWWQKWLLSLMYVFFRIVSHIDADKLNNASVFFEAKYECMFEATFYRGFIQSVVYRKE